MHDHWKVTSAVAFRNQRLREQFISRDTTA
jgi:hypothetical protein